MTTPGSPTFVTSRGRPGRWCFLDVRAAVNRAKPAAIGSGLLLVPILQAAAVAVVAYAFALARSRAPLSDLAYWVGQTALVVPTAYVIARCRPTQWGAISAVTSTAVASFVVMVSYEPLYLTFADEFQHYETLHSILTSGHLFAPNTALPVSSLFPGLEIVSSAVVQMTHVSTYVAELAIAGSAHVTTLLLVYAILRTVTGNIRASTIGALVYTLNPQYEFIDSYFTYTMFGLLFTFSAILCLLRSLQSRGRASKLWALGASSLASVCVVSHHVSSYLCVAFFVVVLVCEFASGRPRCAATAAWALLPASLVVLLWTTFVAPEVIGYLAPVGHEVISGLLRHSVSSPRPLVARGLDLPRLRTSPSVPSPSTDKYLEYFGTAVLLIAYSIALLGWLRPRGRPVVRPPGDAAIVIASLLLYVLVAVRLALPDGSELSGRLYAYALLPVAYVVVQGTRRLAGGRRSVHAKPHSGSVVAIGVASLTAAVWLGALAGGWPPAYARLPGPTLAGAWERSMDPAVIAASQWAASHLEHHLYFVSDQMTAGAFAGLGDETAVSAPAATIFLTRNVTPGILAMLRQYDISLIVVNRIISEGLPADGKYFTDDPFSGYYASPIPWSDITKFLTWTGGSVIYSNGQVSIIAVNAQ